MRKPLSIVVILFCVPGILGLMTSCTKSRGPNISEVTGDPHALKQAPSECLVTFREFFQYVQKSEPSIITDTQAQNRWLSENLRKALANNLLRFENQKNVPDYPSNADFVGVWDMPTTYSIVGSRQYDNRDWKNPNANRVIVDVLYEWDSEGSLDNNYPGTNSLRSFIFVYEDGMWKLDDIYNFRAEYESSGSLSSYWWRD
jgi:hypothetical protein